MFSGCDMFNQPLNNWNVSNVTNMSQMFMSCFAFNQPLNNWNVSNVTDMAYMFYNCNNFNEPLNNWNVSNVTDMQFMFSQCINFNQDLSNWTLRELVNTNSMFSSANNMREEFKPRIETTQRQTQGRQTQGRQTQRRQTQDPAVVAERNIQNQARETTGVAFHVHNKFDEIDMTKLIELVNNGKLKIYPKNFGEYVKNELQTMIDNYDKSDKQQLQTMFNRLSTKMSDITYSNNDINICYTVIDFVKRQEKSYQDNYIKLYLTECFNAYDGSGDNTSCVRGIKERLVFSLGQAGFDIDNPLYANISELLFPISNSQIYTFLSNCIKDNQTRLDEIGEGNDKINEKKELVKQCVIEKIKSSSPNVNVTSLETNINKALNDAQDMLGGKRKTRKTRKNRKSRKTRQRK